MQKINVNLYGGKGLFGGKESPLQADIIYCDTADKCSLYKNGTCLNCRSESEIKCPNGIVETKIGYTSKAVKYWGFRNTYAKDETYHKLTFPSNFVGLVDQKLYLNFFYVNVEKSKGTKEHIPNKWGYIIRSGWYGKTAIFIDIKEIDIDFIAEILHYKPRYLIGGVISDYQEKIVPNIVAELKKIVPEIYKQLISKYPSLDKKPNYVGRYAYTRTLVDGSVLIDCHGNEAIKKGDMLYCENYKRGFVPFNGSSAQCVIKISENSKYKVTDNSQCDENTIFSSLT